jgi:predicted ATP-grasp superfamily ATP-dependent carboligase
MQQTNREAQAETLRESTASRVAALMEDGVERTRKQIANVILRSSKTVQTALNELSREGPMQLIHVCRRDGNTFVYVNGPGKNVATKTWRDPARAARRARSTEVSEAAGTWWKAADPVITQSMFRMVSMGRAA